MHKDKKYSFGEVVDNMGDVEFKIEELEFDDDPETIITYKNTDRFYDRDLKDLLMMIIKVFIDIFSNIFQFD